jgi:two-component system response regulator FixJ
MTTTNPQFVAIVDDDANLCAAFAGLMESAGLAAQVFPSAEEFLQRAQRGAIRCLVLDLGLPAMSGLDLLRGLRADGWLAPIICVTAQPDSDGQLAKRVFAAGAQAILYKPFDPEELLQLLQSTDDQGKGMILGADG